MALARAKNRPDPVLCLAYSQPAETRPYTTDHFITEGLTKMEHAALKILAGDPEISVHGAVAKAEQLFQILSERHQMAKGDA